MLPAVSPDSHKDYQNFFASLFPQYYTDPFSLLSMRTWRIIVQFWNMDLSKTDEILAGAYSKPGPAPAFLHAALLPAFLKA